MKQKQGKAKVCVGEDTRAWTSIERSRGKNIYRMKSFGQIPSDVSTWTNVGDIRVIVDSNMEGGEAARANAIDRVAGDRDSLRNDWKIPDMLLGQHQEMKVPPSNSEGAVERNLSIQESGYATAASEEQANANGMAQQEEEVLNSLVGSVRRNLVELIGEEESSKPEWFEPKFGPTGVGSLPDQPDPSNTLDALVLPCPDQALSDAQHRRLDAATVRGEFFAPVGRAAVLEQYGNHRLRPGRGGHEGMARRVSGVTSIRDATPAAFPLRKEQQRQSTRHSKKFQRRRSTGSQMAIKN